MIVDVIYYYGYVYGLKSLRDGLFMLSFTLGNAAIWSSVKVNNLLVYRRSRFLSLKGQLLKCGGKKRWEGNWQSRRPDSTLAVYDPKSKRFAALELKAGSMLPKTSGYYHARNQGRALLLGFFVKRIR